MEMTKQISPAEWEVMRIVWTLGPTHADQILSQLQSRWTPSTIKTLLRRLVKKGWLKTSKDGRRFLYQATAGQTAMMQQTAQAMLNQMCAMHQGQLLVDLVKETTLSQQDLQDLQAVAAEKMPTAPTEVPCNCLHNCQEEEAK